MGALFLLPPLYDAGGLRKKTIVKKKTIMMKNNIMIKVMRMMKTEMNTHTQIEIRR